MAINGDSILLTVNTGTEGSPVYTTVGASRSFSFTRTLDTIDVTHKGSTGKNKEYLAGSKGGTITVSSLYVESEAGIAQLEDSYENRTTLKVRYTIAGSAIKEADVFVTSWAFEGSNDTEAIFNVDLLITGAVSDV